MIKTLFELALGTGITIIIIALIAEYFDSTIGMGYGTLLTPLLLMFGFEPLQVIPSVLLSELVTGILAGGLHTLFGNVNLKPKTINPRRIKNGIKKLGIKEAFNRGIPRHLKAALLIATCSIIGTVVAVLLAVSLPKFYLKLYIGILVLIIGIVILTTLGKKFGFSWEKIIGLSLIASFNKGLSGGGYGPVVTGGQILSGVNEKNAIGITSLAEGLTCVVGVAMYLITKATIDWTLAPYLMIGAVLSVPLAVFTVKKIKANKFKIIIGVATTLLGIITLLKLFI